MFRTALLRKLSRLPRPVGDPRYQFPQDPRADPEFECIHLRKQHIPFVMDSLKDFLDTEPTSRNLRQTVQGMHEFIEWLYLVCSADYQPFPVSYFSIHRETGKLAWFYFCNINTKDNNDKLLGKMPKTPKETEPVKKQYHLYYTYGGDPFQYFPGETRLLYATIGYAAPEFRGRQNMISDHYRMIDWDELNANGINFMYLHTTSIAAYNMCCAQQGLYLVKKAYPVLLPDGTELKYDVGGYITLAIDIRQPNIQWAMERAQAHEGQQRKRRDAANATNAHKN